MHVPTQRSDGSFVLSLPPDVYRLSAVKKAAYKFTGTFYITIDAPTTDGTVVTLLPKVKTSQAWDAVIGEFWNEVLDQDLRETIADETKGIRDLILAQAFSQVSIFHPEFDSAPVQAPKDAGACDAAEQNSEAETDGKSL